MTSGYLAMYKTNVNFQNCIQCNFSKNCKKGSCHVSAKLRQQLCLCTIVSSSAEPPSSDPNIEPMVSSTHRHLVIYSHMFLHLLQCSYCHILFLFYVLMVQHHFIIWDVIMSDIDCNKDKCCETNNDWYKCYFISISISWFSLTIPRNTIFFFISDFKFTLPIWRL